MDPMSRSKKFLSFFLGLLFPVISMAATPISICTDTNFWYPFTFIKDKQPAGLHVDIIRQSLEALGYKPSFKPLPWSQCLSAAKAGEYDAVATVSYNEMRSYFLHYPEGASVDKKSPWRVTQVEYRVITPIITKGEPHYDFNGDMKTIPIPVRVPEGYSIVGNLEHQGLAVEQAPHSLDNFNRLAKEQTGSIIDLEEVAEHFLKQPQFSKKFSVSPQPLVSKSYYLAFAKRGAIQQEEADKIWKEIANTRSDNQKMNSFLMKY
jgi:polar amino acid transport system substrate-binding protein